MKKNLLPYSHICFHQHNYQVEDLKYNAKSEEESTETSNRRGSLRKRSFVMEEEDDGRRGLEKKRIKNYESVENR